MKANQRFLKQPQYFWANVRTISEAFGYTNRQNGQIKVPTPIEMGTTLQRIGLGAHHIIGAHNRPTELGQTLFEYFKHRARILNEFVEPRLMDAEQPRKNLIYYEQGFLHAVPFQ